jgi:N-acetyltransferase
MNAFPDTALHGRHVRLEPLTDAHNPGLAAAIRDGELWRLLVTAVPHPDALDAFQARAAQERAAGLGITYTTIDQASGCIAGSTRYLRTDWNHRRTEIGFTFLGARWQRTSLNTEAKLLMLTQAFESLGFNRVELLTDYLNTVSRTAILRLGAREEGVLRSHMVMPNGRVRDSVVFSIVRQEWPSVKQHLLRKLR